MREATMKDVQTVVARALSVTTTLMKRPTPCHTVSHTVTTTLMKRPTPCHTESHTVTTTVMYRPTPCNPQCQSNIVPI